MQMARQSLSCYVFFFNILNSQLKRIRSVPGNRVFPVRSSAIIQPTDQISTETHKQDTSVRIMTHICKKSRGKVFAKQSTRHVVMHPVQHDLRGAVPASGHVAGHLVIRVPRQAEVQNLGAIEVPKSS